MIIADNISKVYRIAKPHQGKFAALRALFHSEYIEKHAVDQVSFRIDDGEIVGYIGPNGAGKSTTIKMLSGILTPTSGTVLVNGLIPYQNRREHAKNIGVVFGQKTSLWWDVPVIDSLQLLKAMYQVDDASYKRSFSMCMDMLDMDSFINQPVRQLSLGQRMRADLAAALIHSPKILFLDEPTVGMDVVSKESLRRFILEVNREYGITTLLTTHDMSDIEKLANRIIIIDAGKKEYDGTVHELRDMYGKNRCINVTFAENEPDVDIDGLKIVNKMPFRYSFAIDHDKISTGAAMAKLANLPYTIRDITVQEVEIEEIIRNIYTNGMLKGEE